MLATDRSDALRLAPALVFLFILPFPHTVALRLLCLFAAAGIAVVLWRRLAPPTLPLKLPILVWAAVCLGSLAVAVDFPYSLRELKNELGYTLLAFVTLFALARDERSLRWLSTSAAGAFLVISLSALAMVAWKGAWRQGTFYAGEGTGSNFLITVAPLVALALWLWRPARMRVLLLAAAVLLLATALFSGQRALWPALGAQVILVCVWLWRAGVVKIDARRALGAVLLVACLVLAGLWGAEQLRTQADRESPAALSKDLRPALWAAIAGRLAEHPFQGAGFGQRAMVKAYPELVPPENPMLWHAHNLVLNYGIYAGLPGAAAILFLFAALFARFWRLALAPEAGVRYAGLAGAAMVAGVFVRNSFNDFFMRDGALLFWALAGMLLGYALRRSR